MRLSAILSLPLVFLGFCINNDSVVATDEKNSAVGDEAATPQKVSCARPTRIKVRTAPSGGVDDITEEMLEIHKKFTPESVEEFKTDDGMRKAAKSWCEVQLLVGCDLVYPLNMALNAAIVPASMKIDDVAQLWYNERSNYNSKISILDNVKLGYHKGYEVIHYANMVASYPGRSLGCCRAPCKDGLCLVYACAYGPKGAGFWRIRYDNASLTETKSKEAGHPHTGSGFEFHSDIGTEVLHSPRTEMVRRVPRDELTLVRLLQTLNNRRNYFFASQVGCSANVAGNGPTVTLPPWQYPCLIPKVQEGINKASTLEEALAAATTAEAQTWRQELEILFNPIPVLTASCDELATAIEPPLLVYCSNSCMAAAIKQHKEILQSATKLRNKEEKETPDYRVSDVGNSICGQAASHKAVGPTGGLVRVLAGGLGDSFNFDEQGMLAKQTCTATEYSFLSCGANRLECLSHVRIPSKNNPWISSNAPTAAKDDIGELLFILRNSLCKGGEFSLSTRAVFPSRHQLGVLAHYLNPSNFIALRLDIANQVASLIECVDGTCEKKSRYIVGGLDHRIDIRVNSLPTENETSSRVAVTVNDEDVGVIDKTRGPPIGFFGFAVEEQQDLQLIDNVSLIPIMAESKKLRQDIHKLDSLLPLWRIEGSNDTDVPIVS